MAGYVVLSEFAVGVGVSRGRHHDASGFLLCRQVLASTIILCLALCRHEWRLPSPKQQRRVFLLGIFQFLNAMCFVGGVSLAGGFVAAVCQLAIPVFSLAYACATGRERPSLRRAFCMISIVGGCALTAGGHVAAATLRSASDGGGGNGSTLQLAGVGMLLVQCMSFVGIVFVQRDVLQEHPVALVISWSYALATLWTLCFCVADGSIFRLGSQLTTREDALAITFSATFGAAIYFELLGVATKHLPPTLVTCTVALEPLTVSILGVVVFGRRPAPLEMCGYAIASFGACYMGSMVGPALDDGREDTARSLPPAGKQHASDVELSALDRSGV